MSLAVSPRWFARLMSLWPPLLGAGIRVRHISPQWDVVRVDMKLRFYNQNYVRTHFGGSLFAMTDPFYMLMLTRALGPAYRVLDHSAEIEFLRPGLGRVSAEFRLDPSRVAKLREEAADGSKLLPEFMVDVVDEAGEVVARVRKRVYVRLKQRRPAQGSNP